MDSWEFLCGFLISTSSDLLWNNSTAVRADDVSETPNGLWSYEKAVTSLEAETRYYYRSFVRSNGLQEYGEIKSFTTGRPSELVAVDLGLSVKWGSMNLGATEPEDYGDYFAWGETSPKDEYTWKTYKWASETTDYVTKYSVGRSWGGTGDPDKKSILELEDDAAHVALGGKWRMPTMDDWEELDKECTWLWSTRNGLSVCEITSKVNGNSIVLPPAGNKHNSMYSRIGSNLNYWSSTLDWVGTMAFGVSFSGDGMTATSNSRYYGQSVRPVTD